MFAQGGEAVEQQIDQGLPRDGGPSHQAGRLQDIGRPGTELTRLVCGPERLKQGGPRQARGAWRDYSGRLEQDRRCFGQLTRRMHDEALQPSGHSRGHRIPAEIRRCLFDQCPCRWRFASQPPRFGRRQHSLCPAPSAGCELGRPF
jgi:hypothetical protein